MPADQDIIKRLELSRDRWKTLAIALLVLVFVVMCPFTVVMNDAIQRFGPNKYEPKITTVGPPQPPRVESDK
jgi:hypothetical protein